MPASDRTARSRAHRILLFMSIGAAAAAAVGPDDAAPAPVARADLLDPAPRLDAARGALQRLGLSTDPLTVAALAAMWETPPAQPDPAKLRGLTETMARLRADFGAPRVSIEPTRPNHPSDREAASAVTERLSAMGFETPDARASQASRRSAADRAVQAGVDTERALRALEAHPDFVVRVQVQETLDDEAKPTYGIAMKRCQALLRFEVVHGGDATRVVVPEVPSTRFGRDASIARSMAVRSACEAGGTPLAMALANEWAQLGREARGRVIEIDGSPAEETLRLPRPVEVLEAVPGVRTVVRLAPGDPRGAADFGTPLLERPGYALVEARGASVGRWAMVLLAGGTALAAGGWMAWRWRVRARFNPRPSAT